MDIHTWCVITAMNFPLEDDNKPSQVYPGFSRQIDSSMGRMPSGPVTQPPGYQLQPSGHGFNGDTGTAVEIPIGGHSNHGVGKKEYEHWHDVQVCKPGDMQDWCKDPEKER
jgi:hypothetical protein